MTGTQPRTRSGVGGGGALWTGPADVATRLTKRWKDGKFLTRWARGDSFEPVTVSLEAPKIHELSERFDDVRAWVGEWSKFSAPEVTVRWRFAGHRSVGANELPTHVDVTGYGGLWRLLDVERQVARFSQLREATGPSQLVTWMNTHPMLVLRHEAEWDKLTRVVEWIAQMPDPSPVFLREVPVPGVDTKFIERNRGVLAQLLDTVLSPERVVQHHPASAFERRYGFARKPDMVRCRSLDPDVPMLPGLTELQVRVDEFVALDPAADTVFILENEITYLALPKVAGALALLGGGFAVSTVGTLRWLRQVRVLYWGDLDTHGFVALDRLRARVPHAESMLMDTTTLLAHRDHWGQEPVATATALAHLTPSESQTYRALVEGTFGERIRLEQERVGFLFIEQALARVHSMPQTSADNGTEST